MSVHLFVMGDRVRKSSLISALVLATGLAVLHSSMASAVTPRKASLTSSGVQSISLFTYQDSTEGWITFRLKDPSGIGANVSQCDVNSRGGRVNCDTYPLRAMDYPGGAWKVRKTSDGWTIRIYVGYYSASQDYCWDSRAGQRIGVQIAILTKREQMVTRNSHTYTLRCDGVASQATGPSVLTAIEGRDSLPFTVKAAVVDRRRAVAEIRRCFYDVELSETTNCFTDPTSKVAQRTSTGWAVSRKLMFNNVSARECRYYQNERPRMQYRMSFLDGDGNRLGNASLSFRLTCRG